MTITYEEAKRIVNAIEAAGDCGVLTRVQAAQHRFYERYGSDAAVIYLGRLELKILRAYAQDIENATGNDSQTADIIELFGIPVVKVDADSYAEVGPLARYQGDW